MRWTNEHDQLTTGVLFEIAAPTLVEQFRAVRVKAGTLENIADLRNRFRPTAA